MQLDDRNTESHSLADRLDCSFNGIIDCITKFTFDIYLKNIACF